MFQQTQNLLTKSNINTVPMLTSGTTAGASRVSKKPIINQPGLFAISSPWGAEPEVSYPVLWATMKSSPELVAVFTAITEDIVSDGWTLTGGRNNKKQAEEFLLNSHAREVFFSWVFDALVTGDSYLYTRKLSETDGKSIARKIHHRLRTECPTEVKSLVSSLTPSYIFEELKASDEDLFSARSFVDVPSSTMKIKYNPVGGDVKQYVQKVGDRVALFSPDEMIHFRLMRLDGKVYGYSPHRVCTSLSNILRNIREYARNYFERGGVPDYMFLLKNETPQSDNFKNFKDNLANYASLRYRYKSMALCGDIDVKELNQMTKDMEFRELARFLTQNIAMVWGLPASRLSDMLIQSGQKGSVTSSEGYYRKINYYQSNLEDLINTQLLQGFGDVKLTFNKTYKQDEVREANIQQIRTDVLEKWYNNGWIKDNYLFDQLGIAEEDRGDLKPKMPMMGATTNRNKRPSDLDLLSPSSDKRFDDATKRDAAKNS